MNKVLSWVLSVVFFVLVGTGMVSAQTFPTKSINDVVFSSAGGGTDLVNRQLGARMGKELGQSILVSNMPGGLGGTAAEYVWAQPHDGYSLLGVSETSSTFLVNEATRHGAKDWQWFIVGGSPGVIAVSASSPYKTVADFIAAAKVKARGIKIGNSGNGKLWHMKAVILQKAAGVQFLHIPYNGSNPAILAVLSGEVDAVTCALSECSEQVRAGGLRILALTEETRVTDAAFKSIPAITESYPAMKKYFPMSQWLGFAVPKDTSPAVIAVLGKAFDSAMKDPSMVEFLQKSYLVPIGLWGSAGLEYSIKSESFLSWISKEIGVTKLDPASLGINKPDWAE